MINTILFYLILLLSGASWATSDELVIPTPELPTTFDPTKSLDVFSNNAIRQIHRSLFKLNSSGEPVPDLIKNFQINSEGLEYRISLVDTKFSNLKRLSAAHVSESLGNAIQKKVNGFQKFSCIKGYDAFLSKKRKNLEGISIIDDENIVINLNCKISRLPYLLADLRYAIIYSESTPEIGLGDYKVSELQEDPKKEINLETVRKIPTFKKIKYKKATSNEALNLLTDKSKNVFLFSYKLDRDEKSKISEKFIFYEMRSWTNYFLAINSIKNSDIKDRTAIARMINRKNLLQNCYGNENTDDNIFPYGFPGYIKDFKKTYPKIYNKTNLEKQITLSIFNGVGNEDCLKNELSRQLGKRAKVEIVSTETGISKWVNNKTDVILFYLESELNLDVSQFFSLDAEFFLGKKNDKKTLTLVNNLSSTEEPVLFKNAAIKLQNRILDQHLLLPLFIPKSQILFSPNIQIPDLGMIPPTYLTFKDLKLKEESGK